MSVVVSQQGAHAAGDIAARDNIKITNTYVIGSTGGSSHVLLLKKRLTNEMSCNQRVKETVENLIKYYKNKKPYDGIIGLENKLTKANRQTEIQEALEDKEEFAKFLERWSMYAAAQEIFAYLLGKIDDEFNKVILPRLGTDNQFEINTLISDRVVTPVIVECGVDEFLLSHSIVRGMIYWLAERCFVRWHA